VTNEKIHVAISLMRGASPKLRAIRVTANGGDGHVGALALAETTVETERGCPSKVLFLWSHGFIKHLYKICIGSRPCKLTDRKDGPARGHRSSVGWTEGSVIALAAALSLAWRTSPRELSNHI
jgi:hypothetical protein